MKFKPTFLICLILMTLCISCVSGINPENNTTDNIIPIVENNTLDDNITNRAPFFTIVINGNDSEFIINNLKNIGELQLQDITIENSTDNGCIIKLQKGKGIYCEIRKDGSYFVRGINNTKIIIIDDLNDDAIIFDYKKTLCLDLNRFNRIYDFLYFERLIFSNWFWPWFW